MECEKTVGRIQDLLLMILHEAYFKLSLDNYYTLCGTLRICWSTRPPYILLGIDLNF